MIFTLSLSFDNEVPASVLSPKWLYIVASKSDGILRIAVVWKYLISLPSLSVPVTIEPLPYWSSISSKLSLPINGFELSGNSVSGTYTS